jgi:magnesium transporter
MKRAAWPLREALNTLIRDPAPLIHSETRVHLRDCYDHTFQIIELVETYREICSDLMNLHLSSVNNRMSEVMKVLTIISTIFIPLTFIVGVYGMNFNTAASDWNMPELNWAYGYPAVVAFMVILALSLMVSFRRRGWIGQ